MKADAARSRTLSGWTPVLGALSIWFAHFLAVYGAALIWPHQPLARAAAAAATIVALAALGILFWKLRSAAPTDHQTRFGRRFGFGSIFIAAAGTVFDALPALFG